MKMKMKLLFVPIVMVMMSVPGVTTFIQEPTTTSTTWTTARPAVNLNGKMFTLSSDGGGISFYPPSSTTTTNYKTTTTTPRTKTTTTTPRTKTTTTTPKTTTTTPRTKTTTTTPKTTTTTPPKTTTTTAKTTTTTAKTTTPKTSTTTPPKTATTPPKTTTTTAKTTTTPPKTTTTTAKTTTQWTTTPPRTTPFSTTGLSVCLAYLTDYLATRDPVLLKLFPSSSNPVTLGTSSGVFYSLTWDVYYYNSQTFKPNVQFWPGGFSPDIWTRVCVTVDSVKNVGQVFSGSNMSIRKMLPSQFPQGQDPVIYVPGFDGQLTDVQMWDYPLNYREIIQYMRPSSYRPSRGSVLTWSDISYSLNGKALLEDTYEMQEQQPISKRGRGRGLRGEKKSRMVF